MFIKHGDHLTKLYALWRNFRHRCKCKTSKDYKHYGARGIFVCQEWESYPVFKNWATLNGYRQGLVMERKNNDGGYCPENCIFTTIEENNKNRRSAKLWNIKGIEFRSSYDAARHFKVCATTISRWCYGNKQGKYYYPPKPNCTAKEKYDNHKLVSAR